MKNQTTPSKLLPIRFPHESAKIAGIFAHLAYIRYADWLGTFILYNMFTLLPIVVLQALGNLAL